MGLFEIQVGWIASLNSPECTEALALNYMASHSVGCCHQRSYRSDLRMHEAQPVIPPRDTNPG